MTYGQQGHGDRDSYRRPVRNYERDFGHGNDRRRGCAGCGCAGVLVIVLIATLLLWALSFLDTPSPTRKLEPVPEDVPPAAGKEVQFIDVHGPGRTADLLYDWSQDISGQTNVAGQAIRAYANAELIARDAWPQCNLRWTTLAGIGWVETRHGTYSGNWFKPSELDSNGYALPKIIGIPLDGTNGTARIEDTDNGEFDGDSELDRAVGPMQFIPASWGRFGLDANGDGKANPHQIDDAALSAANLLCSGGRDLNDEQQWMQAIYAYNRSTDYLRKVARAANSYAIGQPAAS